MTTDVKTWRHDSDGFTYKNYEDAAGHKRRQYAEAAYLNGLEDRAALVDDLTAALEALVTKLHVVHDDAAYNGVWVSYHIHGGVYTGPQYELELDAADAALARLRTAQAAAGQPKDGNG